MPTQRPAYHLIHQDRGIVRAAQRLAYVKGDAHCRFAAQEFQSQTAGNLCISTAQSLLSRYTRFLQHASARCSKATAQPDLCAVQSARVHIRLRDRSRQAFRRLVAESAVQRKRKILGSRLTTFVVALLFGAAPVATVCLRRQPSDVRVVSGVAVIWVPYGAHRRAGSPHRSAWD